MSKSQSFFLFFESWIFLWNTLSIAESATSMQISLISITHAIYEKSREQSVFRTSVLWHLSIDKRQKGMGRRKWRRGEKKAEQREVHLSGEEYRAILRQKPTTSLHLLNFKKESQQLIHNSSLAFSRRDVETIRHCIKLAKRRRRRN